jgi:hypothetical protein
MRTDCIIGVANIVRIRNNCPMNSIAAIDPLGTAFKCNCLVEVDVIDNRLLFGSHRFS